MEQNASASTGYEPTLSVQLLPRCPDCGDRHPLAYDPPLSGAMCPSCGLLLATPPAEVTVRAVLTGTRGRVAGFLLKIGAALSRLAK